MLYIYIRLYVFCFFFTCCLLSLFHIVSSSLSLSHTLANIFVHSLSTVISWLRFAVFILPLPLTERGCTRAQASLCVCVCVCSFCACMCFLIVQALNSVLPHFTLATAQPQLIFRPALRPYEQRPSLRSPLRALSTCIRTYHFLSCRFHLLNFIAIASLFA